MAWNTNDLDLRLAEVLDVAQDTYNYKTDKESNNINQLFSVLAQIDDYTNQAIIKAKPANNNIKKIPMVGEMILIFKIKSSVPTTKSYSQEQWFYLSTVDIKSSINHNSIPGYGDVEEVNRTDDIIGNTFKESNVSPLQPYEGDVIVEGRSGNSIRFSSTLEKPFDSNYYIDQSKLFTGKTAGDPILIISNNRKNKPAREFVTEDINNDGASVWLTSSQRVTGLSLNHKNMISDAANFYNKSQLIGKADRIILSAKQNDIILDAKQGIEINAPKIMLGSSSNKEGLLHSTAVVKLLQKIISVINSGNVDIGTGSTSLPFSKELQSKETMLLLNQLTSDYILIDQYKK